MNSVYNVIIRPVVSERTFDLMGQNKYTFEVAKDAPKEEIRDAVEKIFNVHVVKGKTRTWKKAIVTIAEGESIEIFGAQAEA